MQEFFGAIGVGPGVAAILLMAAAALKFGWEWREKVQQAGKQPENMLRALTEAPSVSWQTNMTAALTNLASAIAALGDKSEDISDDLSEVRRGVDSTNIRLTQLATREEVTAIAAANRHAMANHVQALMLKLQDIHDDVKEKQ